MSKPVLQVIVGSTRPGRIGPAIATWFVEQARATEHFEVELVDLAEFELPIFDEPNHPMLQKYEHEHTKRWSATVVRGDAFVFVIPEYNHSVNAAVKNAIDYLHAEWKYKGVGLVSYGGVSGGIRAIQALKPVLTALKMFHAGDVTVNLQQAPVADGAFGGNDVLALSASTVLAELAKTAPALRLLRS